MPNQCGTTSCAASRLGALAVDAGFAWDDSHVAAEPQKKANLLEGFAEPDTPAAYARDHILTVVHSDIHLDFDFPHAALDVAVTHTVRGHHTHGGGEAASRLTLHGINFENLALDGDQLATFDYDGSLITVRWDTPLGKSEERKITFKYRVVRPISGIFFAHPSYSPSHLGTHAITDHETEKARYWLASVDEPATRAKLTFHLTAPKDLIAVANGALVSENVSGDKKTTVYNLDFPCPTYLLCLAVGDFVAYKDRDAVCSISGKKIPCQYFGPKGYNPEEIYRGLKETPSMIEWLTKKVGHPLPWPKYFQITSPFIGGAMENISFVTWTDYITLDPTHARDWAFHVQSVNIHEMAHTFFGDLQTIRHFEHAWMKESWATIIESVWIEDCLPNHIPEQRLDFAKLYRLDDNERYFGECERYVRPIVSRIYEHSWCMFDSHTYPGGAARIHMLRKMLGDDVFWPAVSEYLKRFAQKTVETEDFRKVLEEFSGLNLNLFFDQWFYGRGYPKLKIKFEHEEEHGLASVVIEQCQGNAAKAIPALFAMDVPVEFVFEDGAICKNIARFTNDTRNGLTAIATVAAPKKPVRIEIDPDQIVLFDVEKLQLSREMLLAMATKSRDVINRVRAYRVLAKEHGDFATVRKMGEAILADPCPGVRAKAAKALSKLRHEIAIDELVKISLAEKDDLARCDIYDLLSIKSAPLRACILAMLNDSTKNLTHRQRGTLLTSLAQHRNMDDWPLITKFIDEPALSGHADWVLGAAILAVAHYRTESAAQYLIKQYHRLAADPQAHHRQHHRVRVNLTSALGNILRWIESRATRAAILECICLSLFDKSQQVRFGALFALSRAGHPDAADSQVVAQVNASLNLTAIQNKIRFQPVLKALRKQASLGGAEVKGLESRIEELEKLVTKLQEKILAKEELDEKLKAKLKTEDTQA